MFLAYDPGIKTEQEVEVVVQESVPMTEPDEFKVLKVKVPFPVPPQDDTDPVAIPPREEGHDKDTPEGLVIRIDSGML